jgi:ATP-dependent DNA helicase DinG
VFTSATLAVGENFEHFCHRAGLQEPQTLRLDSPFDYVHNALLYLPPSLPNPGDTRHTAAVIAAARSVLACSAGRAFLLFTSHRALRAAAEALGADLPYPLLVQGSAPRSELLQRFRESGNAVLLGTGSFWEGVDVRGEALSCVLIDKLPFASPGDPVLNARIEAMRAEGGNPFVEYQLPQAVIALKQGVGRLIRDVSDRGVLVLCDPRLRSKSYGKIFLESLPPMPRTTRLADVRTFFASAGGSGAGDSIGNPAADAGSRCG